MFDEKNIYVRQAEVKGSFKQNSNGTFLIGELTVNSSLKNYEKVLHSAFEITMKELTGRNENQLNQKEKTSPATPKKEKNTVKNVKGMQ